MTLPPSEIERIENLANEFAHNKWKPFLSARDTSNWATTKEDYIAGAQAEAVRGREMAKGFAEWIYFNGWKHVYGRPGFHHPTGDDPNKIHTTAELLDLYILDTQKRKG